MISILTSPRRGRLRFHGSHGTRMASKPDSTDCILPSALPDEEVPDLHGHDAADRESKPAKIDFPASPRSIRRDLQFWDNVETPLGSDHRKRLLTLTL